MIAKSLFLVLLGTTLVLANPIPVKNNQDISVPEIENAVVEGKEDSKHINKSDVFDDNEEDEVTALTTTEAPKGLERKWNILKNKWSKIIEKEKKKWIHIKDESVEFYETLKNKWDSIREKGLKLIEEAKELYDEVKTQGEEAIVEFKKIYKTVKEALVELEETGKDAYADIQSLFDELKKATEEAKETYGGIVSKLG